MCHVKWTDKWCQKDDVDVRGKEKVISVGEEDFGCEISTVHPYPVDSYPSTARPPLNVVALVAR